MLEPRRHGHAEPAAVGGRAERHAARRTVSGAFVVIAGTRVSARRFDLRVRIYSVHRRLREVLLPGDYGRVRRRLVPEHISENIHRHERGVYDDGSRNRVKRIGDGYFVLVVLLRIERHVITNIGHAEQRACYSGSTGLAYGSVIFVEQPDRAGDDVFVIGVLSSIHLPVRLQNRVYTVVGGYERLGIAASIGRNGSYGGLGITGSRQGSRHRAPSFRVLGNNQDRIALRRIEIGGVEICAAERQVLAAVAACGYRNFRRSDLNLAAGIVVYVELGAKHQPHSRYEIRSGGSLPGNG